MFVSSTSEVILFISSGRQQQILIGPGPGPRPTLLFPGFQPVTRPARKEDGL